MAIPPQEKLHLMEVLQWLIQAGEAVGLKKTLDLWLVDLNGSGY